MRWLTHLVSGSLARRHFPPATLEAIQHAIADGESQHLGEIVFAVEGSLSIAQLLHRPTPRDRAENAFAQLRVWDTRHNTGVLIYVLLADYAIEILADRGIAAQVDEDEWRAVCALMQQHFTAGKYQAGAIAGINAVNAILVRHIPSNGQANPDELPDRPVLL